MKNSEFSLKIRTLTAILVFIVIGSLNLLAQSTITSTTAGGNWNAASTWVGAVVPTASDHVVINGTVYLNGDFTCTNLTVNSSCSLINQYGYSPTITINGKVLNNGNINTNPSGYSLYLNLLSDLENNGKWAPNRTTLSGNKDQNIKQSTGKTFQGYFLTTDSIGQILLGSDVTFDSNTWDWNLSKLRTNGFRLNTFNYLLSNGTIISNDRMVLKSTSISSMSFTGNYEIDGKVAVRDGNVFNGTATILDTLYNQYGYNPTLTINGKIINKGKIINNPGGYSFYLNTFSDIENQGVWIPRQTTFSSMNAQHIKQTDGKSIQGYLLTTDSIGDIILDSNVLLVGNTWDMNKCQIQTNTFNLLTQDCVLKLGKILANSNETLSLKNSAISEMRLSGNYKIDGKVHVRDGNVFNGTATVLDTLFNQYGYNPTVTVNGKLINNGVIINNPGGYSIYLNIFNDIENNGIWEPRQTTFSAKNNQRIKQTAGKSIQGYLLTTDSIGDIILDSDVLLVGNTWDLNKCQIQTNKFNLLTQDYVLKLGKILANSNETLRLKNSAISEMRFFGNYKIDGKVHSRDGNFFNGTATVLDTLFNQYGYNPTVTVNGKLINNGVIISNPGGYSLYMNLFNDLENNGIWAPNRTTFSSDNNQRIKQSAGKSIRGYMLSIDSIGDIILDSDVLLAGNTWDLNKCQIQTNKFNLLTQDCLLNKGKILANSNETLKLKNTAILEMLFSGNYKIDGKIHVRDNNVFNGTVTVLDTLFNQYGYNPTITVNGKIINNGYVISNPQGYSLFMNIFSDIENNGIWAPNRTTFSGKKTHRLKQSLNKSFKGYMYSSDPTEGIILDSDVLFEANTWDMNNSQVQTNKFKMRSKEYLFNKGKISSNDTLILANSRLSEMTFDGNYKISGLVSLRDGNTMTGNATILDTLYNQYGYNPTLTITGNLINYGTIAKNPSGYSLHLSISGNLENNHQINVNNIYLTGTNDRTISGRNAIGTSGTFYADNEIGLIGDNILPNLNFTSNPLAGCIVKKGATLTLLSLANSSRIKNNGRISVTQDIDNTVDNTYNYYAASARTMAKTLIGKIAIDNYGNQQHPTATGTINTWWRLRNTPQLFNDSLVWLKLNYLDETLNGIIEDSIKVFHSPNSGLSWKRIKKGYTIDKANNLVTINKAPSFGHYLLSNSALGITSFQPLVESAEPRFGGNTGQLTMYLFGAGFKKTSTVKLTLSGQSDIKADSTWLTDILGEAMLAKFDLKNKSLGIYDVVIETPGEKTLTLPAHFTIMKGERSDPWSVLSGRDRFLINRWQTFNIGYGNTANTDALGTVLVFVINDLPGLEVEFPDINIVLPKPIVNMGPNFTRFRDIGLYYTTETLTGYENQKMRVYPFYIPYINAASSNSTRVKVKLNGPGSLRMDSWIMDPLFEKIDYNLKSAEPMPSEVRACITAAAMHAWANGALGLAEGMIPGVACWGVIDKTVDPIGYITPDSLKPEGETREDGKATWGSWLWSGVSIMASAVQCGASFVPGVGQAVNLGIGLVNMGIDMKDGYDATQGCWRKFKKKSQNKLDSKGVTSFDPNEKVGPRGYTSERYISKEGNLNYTIFFENKKTAEASALEVFITDTLDIKKFDFKTFSFSSVTFGETTAKVQEYAKEFQILVDLYPKKNIIVQVHGALDTIKGIVSWDFHSLDRITMELTEDPDMGFLPPNVTGPEGEGNVTFSCKLKDTVKHGDIISNRASIVFDFNAPILTNIYKNRIDAMTPVSSVASLPSSQRDSIFTVSWTGDDFGSRISKINIFVSTNDKEYILWKVASASGEAKFTGKDKTKYKFFSEAIDSIGFVEPIKTTAEAVTTLDFKTGVFDISDFNDELQVFPNPAKNQCSIMFTCKAASDIGITLIDISGKTIRRFENKKYQAGKQTADINIEGIPEGVYIVKVLNNNQTFHKKLVISKK